MKNKTKNHPRDSCSQMGRRKNPRLDLIPGLICLCRPGMIEHREDVPMSTLKCSPKYYSCEIFKDLPMKWE
jgi:hypothetical protein